MKDRLKAYEEKRPEIVFHWSDPETEAQGWTVINSLRGGAAGGGTRMRKGLTEHEVLSLAKTMEIKFTVAGPAIGGAKSGIDFDPNDPRKQGVLERWYKAVRPLLKNYYGTGGDLNVDQKTEVIPITRSLDILHPQEGVLQGHFGPTPEEKENRIVQLQTGVSLDVTDPDYAINPGGLDKVGDLITGYGVAESVRHYYDLYEGSLKDKRVIIQGWGNVAAPATYYLAQSGAHIVGIIDRVGGLINPEGFSFDEIKELCLNKTGNYLTAADLLTFDEANEKIWKTGAEVFIPAAASRLVTQAQLDTMVAHGLEVISAGANVPFADREIFYGPIAESADRQVAVIPDFISNCGMARAFGYLMQGDARVQDAAIFRDTSHVIREALASVKAKSGKQTHVTETAYGIALEQLI